MKPYRVVSVILLIAFLINSALPVASVKAQSFPLFEGTIAYVDTPGNIILVTGDGSQFNLTQDGSRRLDDNDEDYVAYGCLKFSPDGRFLYFDRYASFENRKSEFKGILYNTQNRTFSDLFDGTQVPFTSCGLRWYNAVDYSYITAQLEGVKFDALGDPDLYREKVYRRYLSGEEELLFDVVTTGIGYAHGEFINERNKTVIYKGENPQVLSVMNWMTGSNNQIDLPSGYNWDPYSLSPDGNYFIVGLEAPADSPMAVVDIRDGHVYLSKYWENLRWSPDSKQILSVSTEYNDSLSSANFFIVDPLSGTAISAFKINFDGYDTFTADWSPSGKYISIIDWYGDNQGTLLLSENLKEPVKIDTNIAQDLFWLSGVNEKLLYVKSTPIENNDFSREMMLYDPQTGDIGKIGDLYKANTLYVSGGTSLFEVAWTNGKVDSDTVPLVTMTPSDITVTVTPQPAAVPCPFELIFQEKEGVINSLQNPPQISDLETGFVLPFDFLEPSNWKYKEEAAQNLVNSMRKECESYSNGTMTPEEKVRFEAKVMTFKRLTFTEIALNGLYPQYLNTVYEASDPLSELLFSAFSVLFSISDIGDWLSKQDSTLANIANDVLTGATNFYLDFIDYVLDSQVSKLGKMAKTTFHPLIQMIQTVVDPEKGIKDIGKESFAQKLLASFFIDNYVTTTQYEIDIAVANVPLGNDPKYPFLNMTGTDREAEDAIDTLLQESRLETEKTLETMRILGSETSGVDLLGDALDISAKATLLASPATGPAAPATVSLAAFLENLSNIMESSVLAMRVISTGVGASHGGNLISYATNSADIAFDPSKLNSVLAHDYRITNLDVASLDFVPVNYIPASTYYSHYQEQTNASIDNYKASIERLMQAIASGQDEQIQVAAEELLRMDDELRTTLKITEAPLGEMPYDRPEVQNLEFSVQDLRTQSVTLHVALAIYMVQKTSPEIKQETQIIVADALISADNFKTNYDVLAQSGLAIPIKFLPVILDAKTPDTIVEGDSFSMAVKLSNAGQISQQTPVTLSVAGGDKVKVPESQPLPEITPNSQIEIPVNIKAIGDGNEFITIELTQDGNVIASKIVYLEIEKSEGFFSVPPTSYLVGGGLGLLCLTILTIGGVFIYTRTRKPKRAPAKSVSRPQAVMPVSGSAEQIKKAIELSKVKRHQEAFEILRGIVQKEPNNMSAWFNLGGVLASMGKYKDAERCYERAKRLGHPRGDDALNWLRQQRK